MADVAIVGGGPAGLAASLFAARRGHRVTLIEPDPPPPDGSADDDFACWARKGVPHARQGHIFLARSTQILREEAGDVLSGLLARGVVEVPLGGDDDAANLLSRRLVYEGVLRRAVGTEPGVTVIAGVKGAGLRADRAPDGTPRVVALRTEGGEELRVDVVVDASGRGSRAPTWLRDIGAPPPYEISKRCGIFYVTRHYRLRAGESFPTTALPIVAPLDYLAAVVFPTDNGCFQISITGSLEDPYRRRLLDPDVFDGFLAAVPVMGVWLERGEPTCEPKAVAWITNRRRNLVRDGYPVAAGFLLLGDASIQTNPSTGRGLSLALVQAQQLARLLEMAPNHSAALVAEFEGWITRHLGVWFHSQMAIDEARSRQVRAAIAGQSPPPASDATNRLIAGIWALRSEDPLIHDAGTRLYNLLITPDQLMADPHVRRRVLGYLRHHPVVDLRPPGPDRAAFERMASARGSNASAR